ncbi:protein kinase [Paenibacillus sp. 481]|uniref:protein kinase n=1 Tax=Paenibacillus sp. 481 TaxID=2835869 RepID=UPI001E4E1E28|nr:protein kinase [Paenibacillus sp. 481]UHA74054.1 protein kinase [Paenibacillus sp. 481]
MYNVDLNVEKNRLYVKLEGMMTMEEAIVYDQAVRSCVDKAKDGYTFCIDMANAQPAPAEVNEYLAPLREYMARKNIIGSAMIVRSEPTRRQLSRLIKELGVAYDVSQSIEEADRYLDSV